MLSPPLGLDDLSTVNNCSHQSTTQTPPRAQCTGYAHHTHRSTVPLWGPRAEIAVWSEGGGRVHMKEGEISISSYGYAPILQVLRELSAARNTSVRELSAQWLVAYAQHLGLLTSDGGAVSESPLFRPVRPNEVDRGRCDRCGATERTVQVVERGRGDTLRYAYWCGSCRDQRGGELRTEQLQR